MGALRVRNLSISFGGIQALKNVSFDIKPGEIVGLIGPNGAGKTSLLNCISRYYSPSSGELSFYEDDLLKLKPHHLLSRGISRSFQELSLPPQLSVLDNILLGLHHSVKTNLVRGIFDFRYLKTEERKYRRRARDVMRFFADIRSKAEQPQAETGFPDISGRGGYPDLLDVQDVAVGMLPYGIRKKVDLARAFVSRPKLLLLDEPAAGLGAFELMELVDLIRGARADFNTSILLVEHQVPLVMKLCDRIVVLDFGQKIAEGLPHEIRDNPDVIKAYLGSSASKQGAGAMAPGKRSPAQVVELAKKVEAEKYTLELNEVDLHYGHVKALSGVSMKLPDKAITSVLGRNGAGKSTLMKAISGIERISAGEIRLFGDRLVHYLQSPRADQIVRRGVAHVAEGRRVFKELSIMENLRLAGYTLSPQSAKRNIEKVFHYFPMLKEKLKLRDSGNLSGGQQQMLAIGQALMMEPKLLLLDEPSHGLAPHLVEELFTIITNINKNEGCAVLLAEQNADMALRASHYAYVLETGVLLRSGRSEELYNDPEIRKLYLGH